MKIRTHLISGAGNTFHVVQAAPSAANARDLAILACKKDRADGFIFLTKLTENEYSWNFYNNDGTDAEMCGNATRCVGFYLKNIAKSTNLAWSLHTIAGKIEILALEKELFQITMTPINEFRSRHGFYCNTGVPHLIVEANTILMNESSKKVAKSLRFHQDFLPRGTNVTFVVLQAEKEIIQAVSYERGVEDFTLACGTGAAAAAFFNLTKRSVKQTQVEMPGGTLMMNLSDLDRPKMTGPAVLLGSFEYEITV